jgi:hypothetical protein
METRRALWVLLLLNVIITRNMESVIKWQTGKPKESGSYIVTLRFGLIEEDSWNNIIQRWSRNNGEVIAWCKLSDIKPYKEESK